jgi:hypothetical protein
MNDINKNVNNYKKLNLTLIKKIIISAIMVIKILIYQQSIIWIIAIIMTWKLLFKNIKIK